MASAKVKDIVTGGAKVSDRCDDRQRSTGDSNRPLEGALEPALNAALFDADTERTPAFRRVMNVDRTAQAGCFPRLRGVMLHSAETGP